MRRSRHENVEPPRAHARPTVNFGNFRRVQVKQINAFPLIMLLIVVIGMIYWFSGLNR